MAIWTTCVCQLVVGQVHLACPLRRKWGEQTESEQRVVNALLLLSKRPSRHNVFVRVLESLGFDIILSNVDPTAVHGMQVSSAAATWFMQP